MQTLTSVDVAHWKVENQHFSDYLDSFGERVPEALRAEQQRVADELDKAS
jgi:phosphoenolpyruvate carboxykinase (GTP)